MKNRLFITTILLLIVVGLKAQVEIISTGASTAYAVNVPGSFALRNGIQVTFKAHIASAASATLNVSGTGSIAIRKNGDSNPLSAADILLNQVVTMAYDGTFWQMVTPTGSTPSVSNDWTITGNLGTIDGTHFIGTRDNIPFNIRVNNQPSGRIDATNSNSFFGYWSGLNSTGSQNSAMGTNSLLNNTTGTNNLAIGVAALESNILGSNNTAIGSFADVASAGLTNATAIGANAIVAQSNSLVLGSGANVGIGTSSPSAKLDLVGTFRLNDGTEGLGKVLTSDAIGNAKWNGPIIFKGVFVPTGAITINTTAQTVGGTAAYSGGNTYNTSPAGFGGFMTIGNMKFRAPEASYYQINGSLYVAIVALNTITFQIYNLTTSTVIAQTQLNNPDAITQHFYTLNLSTIGLLNVSDEVVLRAQGSSANSGTIVSSLPNNKFEVNLIR